ncbi:MAG: purine-nucleoside phosphorylase [Schwartzia sp.]|nr:purine-nucleoside phosphorylase [Schwartzia sp. (in: firmicutes)]
MSHHIAAKPGEVAERVLMPGDPLRAKHIAETFFEKPMLYSDIRNMLGYTGLYKGVPVSVQGSGMGMPSMHIYASELISGYDAKKIIRVGTCGALQRYINVRDVVMATVSTTDSNICRNTFGAGISFAPCASFTLLEKAVHVAREQKVPFHVGNVLAQDKLYDDELDLKKLASYGVLAAEMEAAALYLAAAKQNVEALAIFTVSNHLLTNESTPPRDRERTFDDMARIALETIIQD